MKNELEAQWVALRMGMSDRSHNYGARNQDGKWVIVRYARPSGVVRSRD